MNHEQRFETFASKQSRTPMAELDALFDALPPVAEAELIGEWDGGVFDTGHPGEQMLGGLKWIGKTFRDRNDVDPIISRGPDGGRVANPILGTASIRTVVYRGVATATMCYDKHAIWDHFRRVNATTLLGVMDRKGDQVPLYFYLRRAPKTPGMDSRRS